MRRGHTKTQIQESLVLNNQNYCNFGRKSCVLVTLKRRKIFKQNLNCSHSSLTHYIQRKSWGRLLLTKLFQAVDTRTLGPHRGIVFAPPSKVDRGQTQVMAANDDVWPHTRITVTELESLGQTTFLWSHAGKVKEYIQILKGCVAGVPLCITFYL